jgi:hypothetical protein
LHETFGVPFDPAPTDIPNRAKAGAIHFFTSDPQDSIVRPILIGGMRTTQHLAGSLGSALSGDGETVVKKQVGFGSGVAANNSFTSIPASMERNAQALALYLKAPEASQALTWDDLDRRIIAQNPGSYVAAQTMAREFGRAVDADAEHNGEQAASFLEFSILVLSGLVDLEGAPAIASSSRVAPSAFEFRIAGSLPKHLQAGVLESSTGFVPYRGGLSLASRTLRSAPAPRAQAAMPSLWPRRTFSAHGPSSRLPEFCVSAQ